MNANPHVPRSSRHSRLGFACLFFAAVLSGCDNSGSGTVITGTPTPEQLVQIEANTALSSGFATADSSGTIAHGSQTLNTGFFNDSSGNGFAYSANKTGSGFEALAALLPTTQVASPPLTGMAAMSGVYRVIEVGKSLGQERDLGEVKQTSGRITLRADFTYATLQGQSDLLSVDARIAGNTLSGQMAYDGRQGQISGLVDGSHAVGIFHGTDDRTSMSGGFLVEK